MHQLAGSFECFFFAFFLPLFCFFEAISETLNGPIICDWCEVVCTNELAESMLGKDRLLFDCEVVHCFMSTILNKE